MRTDSYISDKPGDYLFNIDYDKDKKEDKDG